MSEVVASAPVGVPVIRMLAEVSYRPLDGGAHRAVEELLAWRLDVPSVAATLGLTLEQTRALVEEVEGRGGRRVRAMRVWIDQGHGAVMPGDRNLRLARRDARRGVPRLPVARPGPGDLDRAQLARLAREDGQVVDAVTRLKPDLRAGGGPNNDELFLVDAHLLVTATADGVALSVQWQGSDDEQLTDLVNHGLLGPLELSPRRLTGEGAAHAQALLYEGLGLRPAHAFALPLDAGVVQDRMSEMIAGAESQVALFLGEPVWRLSDWLGSALGAAAQRGVEVVLLVPYRDSLDRKPLAREPLARVQVRASRSAGCGMLLAKDARRALVHSHALMAGAGWDYPQLAAQACLAVHDGSAVEALLGELGVKPPAGAPARAWPPRTVEELAQDAVRKALDAQRKHLPGEVVAAMAASDVEAFCERVERLWVDLRNPKDVGAVAAGVAWERSVYTLAASLAEARPALEMGELRWKPADERIDLDMLVRDRERKVCWVIDAKYGRAEERDVRAMSAQLGIARKHRLAGDGWQLRGLIVHPSLSARRRRDYAELVSGDIERVTARELQQLIVG